MGERESYAPGTFCWTDLGTTDADEAKAFYRAVFGWEAVDAPAGEAGTYTTFKLEGSDVAAMYEMGEEGRASLTPRWSSYVSVEDVDSLAPRVLELGGEVLAHPFDVMQSGRMTALKDPTGATVHLWQPRSQAGAGRVNDTGCIVLDELATPDPPRAPDVFPPVLGGRARQKARRPGEQQGQGRRERRPPPPRRGASRPTGSSTSPPRRST